MDFNTDLLRTFVAIADSGGFTRAAQLVHRTQSAVSMQMKRLEEGLKRPLFERDGRTVALTPEGEMLLQYARRILQLHEEAVSTITQPEMIGMVRIGTPDDYGSFLPSILARYAQCYPKVQVEVRCEPSSSLIETLENGELDLALTTCNPGAEIGEILRREPTVWATSERHFAHETETLPLALFGKECFFRNWALKALNQRGRRYHIAYISPSLAGIQAAVSAGLAVTVLGRSILPPGVRPLTQAEGFPELPAATVTLRRAPGKQSPVIDCLAKQIAVSFHHEEMDQRGHLNVHLQEKRLLA